MKTIPMHLKTGLGVATMEQALASCSIQIYACSLTLRLPSLAALIQISPKMMVPINVIVVVRCFAILLAQVMYLVLLAQRLPVQWSSLLVGDQEGVSTMIIHHSLVLLKVHGARLLPMD
jgi:hypothetical protein